MLREPIADSLLTTSNGFAHFPRTHNGVKRLKTCAIVENALGALRELFMIPRSLLGYQIA